MGERWSYRVAVRALHQLGPRHPVGYYDSSQLPPQRAGDGNVDQESTGGV